MIAEKNGFLGLYEDKDFVPIVEVDKLSAYTGKDSLELINKLAEEDDCCPCLVTYVGVICDLVREGSL